MGAFSIFDTAASALQAQRVRMDVIANNLANVNTTRGANGEPFRRQVVIFAEQGSGPVTPFSLSNRVTPAGVRVVAVVPDGSPMPLVYDPGHPDADEQGFVRLPNVNPMLELVDMISATRAYEANAAVVSSARDMLGAALDILR